MIQSEVSLIAQIELKTNTYYITDRDGVDLDGVTYSNVVLSWGDLPFWGNLGNGESQIGSMDIAINNGEVYQSGGYVFDPTDTWNNGKITIKRWKNVTTHRFSEATVYAVGIIKNFRIEQTGIFFTVDVTNRKDDKLIPGIVGEDQTDLSDSEAKDTFKLIGKEPTWEYIEPTDHTLFSVGELVKLTATNGSFKYLQIREKFYHVGLAKTWLRMNDKIQAAGENIYSEIAFTNIIEKAFREIPKDFVDKVLPIQMGDLTNVKGGVFAKNMTISNLIGRQYIVSDFYALYDIQNIGMWENGTKRFFIGVKSSVAGDGGEYETTNQGATFTVDTSTTLTADITSTTPGNDIMGVADYTQLGWLDEISVTDSDLRPELLGINIIGIDNELFLIIKKPDGATIHVERGYNGTNVEAHSAGSKIYQSAKYSSKNILSFSERFDGLAMANMYYDSDLVYTGDPWNPVAGTDIISVDVNGNGKMSNLVDADNSKYMHISTDAEGKITYQDWIWFNFDVKYPKIEDEFSVIAVYHALKIDGSYAIPAPYAGQTLTSRFNMLSFSPSLSTTADQAAVTAAGASNTDYAVMKWNDKSTGTAEEFPFSMESFQEIDRDNTKITGFDITSLTDLNKKWKYQIVYYCKGSDPNPMTFPYTFKFYNLGLWIDFFVDYTKEVVKAGLKGRKVTSDVATIVGTMSPDAVGDMAENIVDILALLLSQELRYTTDDFADNWQTVKEYTANISNYEVLSPTSPTPEAAFSYGIEDKQKRGWDFVTWLASHYNLQVFKDYEGLIDIANLHQIYNNTPTGSEIKIEHIVFLVGSGNREISIHQTGTDLIFNDIIIKWKRNNSTDEYQEVYKLPDSYTIVKSGITLAVARTDYYGGEKRILEIESPFIYNKADAKRLAEAKADDQAETHFFVDFNIDFEHYTNINSLSNQYKIGDIIYLTGEHGGVTFTSSRKFYIQNTILIDSGRKIKIQAKSVDPISSF